MSTPVQGKRKSEESSLATQERKKAKIQARRAIETQAKPTGDNSAVSSQAPRTIDVVDFAEARAFEINAMNDALKRAEQGHNSSASQLLPRRLRRRAASHNVKRLPIRLRTRAKSEAQDKKNNAKEQAKRVRRTQKNKIQEYTRRQATKKWLETHIWHAKRMKMTELWGFRLADHPCEKSIKSSYRASSHLSMIHDASYFGWIRIDGFEQSIIDVLKFVLNPCENWIMSERYRSGKRYCSTYMYAYKGYPMHLISPVHLLWKPVTDTNSHIRSMLIWVHASAFDEVFDVLQKAKKEASIDHELNINIRQSDFLMFELTGPRSTALLQTVLDLVDEGECTSNDAPNDMTEFTTTKGVHINTDAHKIWRTFRDLRTSASLPPGVVLGLTVHDPRLQFPKKVNSRTNIIAKEAEKEIHELLLHWPGMVMQSDIWDDGILQNLATNKVTDGNLDKRRQKFLIPGRKLTPFPEDSKIPILLITRNSSSLTHYPSQEFINGWAVIIPSHWGMPFWKSFVFAGAWVGGLRERKNQHFECGQSCFPYDFPGCKAYREYQIKEKKRLENEYNKKPPAKRVNYRKLEIEEPFMPPFERLINEETDSDEQNEKYDKDVGLWLLQGSKLVDIIKDDASNVEELEENCKERIQMYMESRGANFSFNFDLSKALVRVRITMLDQGIPQKCAILYRLERRNYGLICENLNARRRTHSQNQPTLPHKDEIIGYITSGQYSFSRGQGFGFGCCTLSGILEVFKAQLK
ncbi:9786_t:CDS:10 [Paraglomus occultum]|uniref:9786_t:CDS:1 n=1 Tax=Paraglomus occultum TaxID=144539 RepID=A0A9N9C742_9GLOM|nr:9786_t:CDS:10 [Paraglomus occultum]